jgi:dUTP pyrophosphatase
VSSIDRTRARRNCLRWARIDPDLPPGLHQPKKQGDIGWDLEAMEDVVIGPMQSADVPVNAQIQLPEGFYADVRNRSSMARRGLYVDQNLIDNGYRGRLFVFIRNMRLPITVGAYQQVRGNGNQDITIRAGERIAQLVFHHAKPVWEMEVEEIDMTTERGGTGFGSTGA